MVSFANQLGLTTDEKAWLAEHRVIRIGIDHNWPPFEFIDEKGNHSGISKSFVDELEKRLGISIKLSPVSPWSETLKAMRQKKLDLMPMLTPNEKRAEYMRFTKAFIKFPAIIVTLDNANYIGSLKDLEGKKVAVGNNYVTHDDLITDYPKIIPFPVQNVTEALQTVKNGKAAAALINLAAYTYETNRLGLTGLKVAAPTEYTNNLAMGVRNDWPELVEIINKTLNAIDTETRSAIKNRWINIHYEFGVKSDTILYWASAIAVVFLFFIAWFYYWNKLLNRKIFEHEANLKKQTYVLAERVKEQTCLYEFSSLMEQRDKSLEEQLTQAVQILPPGWQYPEITEAQITYNEIAVQTKLFRESQWLLEKDVFVHGKVCGKIKIIYLKEKPQLDEGVFLTEERSLINELARQLGSSIERRLDTEALLKQNKAYENRSNLLLESVTEGVLGLDLEGNITFINPSAMKLLSYNLDEILGHNMHDLIHHTFVNGQSYPVEQCHMHKTLHTGEGSTIDNEVFWRKDGTSFDVEYSSVPIYENELLQNKLLTGAVVTFRDISKRKNDERLIQQQQQQLILEMAERKQSAKELEQKFKELERFRNIVVGREIMMIELKSEINELLQQVGQNEKYPIVSLDESQSENVITNKEKP